MGDTDSYFGGFVLAAPGAALASLLLLTGLERDSGIRYLAWLSIAPPMALLFLLIPWVYDSAIVGNHLCGADYNSYLIEFDSNLRWIPVANTILATLIVLSGMYAARNSSSAA